MATFYFRAAAGNWSAAGTWSNSSGGASNGLVPDATTDCILDAGSGANALTIDGTAGSPNFCRSLTCTGFANTLTHGSAKQLNVGDGTTGAFLLVSGMTYAPNAASILKFVSTTTGNNITTAAKRMGPITFDGVGGGWTLQDALDSVASVIGITVTNGALDLNGQAVAGTSGTSFLRSGTATASLTMGTMTYKLGTGSTWDASSSSGFTLSAATSTISAISTTQSPTFQGGGLTYGTYSCTTITTGAMTLAGANTLGTLTLSNGASVGNPSTGYYLAANQTVTGTFTATGNSLINRNLLASSISGTARTISAGTFTITNTDLRDLTKAGAGSGDISAVSSTTGNGDGGGNSGWTFNGVRSVYMKTAVSVNWTAANWYTTSGGSTAATPPLPLLHDTAIFDALSVTAGSKTITLNMPRVSGSTWTGVLNTPAFSTASDFDIYGSLIFVSGMTHTGGVSAVLRGRGSLTFDGGTLTWPSSALITLDNGSGTYTLGRAFTSSSGLATTSGTWAMGGFAMTVTTLDVNGGTVSGTGAITCTVPTVAGGTLTLGGTLTGTGALAISSGTLNMNSNNITGITTYTLSSTGTLALTGTLTFGSSSIASMTGGTTTSTSTGLLTGASSTGSIQISGGTHNIYNMTTTSTSNPSSLFSGGTLTTPVGGGLTSPIIRITGGTWNFGGRPTFTANVLTVAAIGSSYAFA